MESRSSDKKLPNLPGSTEQDLRANAFHPFFKKTPREVWREAEIEHHTVTKPEPCDHEFKYVKHGVECIKCHMGLEGHLDIKKGKLFYKGQQILG